MSRGNALIGRVALLVVVALLFGGFASARLAPPRTWGRAAARASLSVIRLSARIGCISPPRPNPPMSAS